MVTVGENGEARLLNVETGHMLAVLQARRVASRAGRAPLIGVAVSPNGKLVATAGDDGKARLFDLRTHHTLAVLNAGNGPLTGIGFSPDSEHLIIGTQGFTVQFWSTVTPHVHFTVARVALAHASVSVDPTGSGELLIVQTDGRVQLYDCGACGDKNAVKTLAAARGT